LQEGKVLLADEHGLLARDDRDQIRFGFVHGNWALNNSHPDGKHCGVVNELQVLLDWGCYADFTFPSAPDPTQPTTIPMMTASWTGTRTPIKTARLMQARPPPTISIPMMTAWVTDRKSA
jgi:hypothetical protein